MSLQQPFDELWPLREFIVLVVARELCVNVEVREELTRVARILRRNELHLAEHAHRAVRHVLEIADWRRAEVERACGIRSLLIFLLLHVSSPASCMP